MTKNKGRGIFAKCDIKRGTLLIAEKPVLNMLSKRYLNNKDALHKIYENKGMITPDLMNGFAEDIGAFAKNCHDLCQFRGIQALRLSYLDGGPGSDLSIPPLSVFLSNKYKHLSIPEFTKERVCKIVDKYSFCN